ncbi:OsmC family protein [Fundicoccus culcitae]|uniref:OsmC family protein n=1 Tax=Fundicoccus culcitae TaxID=2969821 RepID=A0ABY5P9F5_9LACT|nr:OsmC family protein [Fundicoccus culcitae]UUX34995.1 OsmC family protein [Fundicoccus culcitae]
MSQKMVHAENKANYVVTATVDHFEYTLDFAERNPDKTSVGTTPTGLLVAALAGCHLMTARSFLVGRELDFTALKVDITADFDHKNFDWRMTADIRLQTDAKLDERQVESLKRFIHNHCTVSNVLSHGNTLNLAIELV